MRSSAGTTRPSRRAGFSLLEMLVVLSIMALVAAVSMPNLSASLDALNFDRKSDLVRRSVRQLQARALLEGRTLSFPEDANRLAEGEEGGARQGWRVDGGPIRLLETGICLGGEVTLVAPSGRSRTLTFTAPDCVLG